MLLGPDCVLRPHALFLLARTLADHPDATFVYSDEDRLDSRGARSAPRFKPDWNRELLQGQNYIGPCAAFRRELAAAAGGLPRARRGADLESLPAADRGRSARDDPPSPPRPLPPHAARRTTRRCPKQPVAGTRCPRILRS